MSESFSTQFGVRIDQNLLITALTHRSFTNEHPEVPNNERLEFLGDAILCFVVTEELYNNFGDLSEGELSFLRSQIVSTKPLANFASQLGLPNCLMLGKGEAKSGGNQRSSILENTFEAVVAAVYLSNDLPTVKKFIMRFVQPQIDQFINEPLPKDYKTEVQQLAHKLKFGAPIYTYESTGAEHEVVFTAHISFANTDVLQAKGCATSKKKASFIAAEEAYHKLVQFSDAV